MVMKWLILLVIIGFASCETVVDTSRSDYYNQCTFKGTRVQPASGWVGGTKTVFIFVCDGITMEHAGFDPRQGVAYGVQWRGWVTKMKGDGDAGR